MNRFILISILSLIFISCNNDNDIKKLAEKEELSKKAVALNIQDAIAIAIVDRPENARTNTEQSINLFKVTSDNEFSEIAFYNEDNNIINPRKIRTENIVDIHPDYLLFIGEFNIGKENDYMNKMIVHKETGRFYDMSGSTIPSSSRHDFFIASDYFKRDGFGRIYYGIKHHWSGFQSGYRLDVRDEDEFIIEEILPDGQLYNRFEVDADGNFYYGHEDGIRVRLLNGSVIKGNIDGYLWHDNANNVYLNQSHRVLKLSILNNTFDSQEVSTSEGQLTSDIKPFVINTDHKSFVININGKNWSIDHTSGNIEFLDFIVSGFLLQKSNKFVHFGYEFDI